jgi:tRNA A37 methylthiotransferase MiaB
VEQSRSADSIVAEMKELASQGYREVTLLGQNIDAWGRDMEPKGKFSELLARVGKEAKGIERVRLVLNSLGRLVQGLRWVERVRSVVPFRGLGNL